MRYFESFIITTALFFVLDWLWFMNLASSLYMETYSGLLRSPNELAGGSILYQYFVPVLTVYLLMVLGIIHFAVPSAASKTTASFIVHGALFGCILYGVYNFVAFSLFSGFPLHIALVDTAWGTFSCGLITLIVGKIRYR